MAAASIAISPFAFSFYRPQRRGGRGDSYIFPVVTVVTAAVIKNVIAVAAVLQSISALNPHCDVN
jgi:hypothetical protein